MKKYQYKYRLSFNDGETYVTDLQDDAVCLNGDGSGIYSYFGAPYYILYKLCKRVLADRPGQADEEFPLLPNELRPAPTIDEPVVSLLTNIRHTITGLIRKAKDELKEKSAILTLTYTPTGFIKDYAVTLTPEH